VPLLTVAEAAEAAGVSPSLIYLLVEKGELPHLRLGASGRRGTIRIDEADLRRFLESRRREGEKPSRPLPGAPVGFDDYYCRIMDEVERKSRR
jgi:excisionase family DNA binding protein